MFYFFFFSSRRRHTRFDCDWSSDVCSSDLVVGHGEGRGADRVARVVCGIEAEVVEAECYLGLPPAAQGRDPEVLEGVFDGPVQRAEVTVAPDRREPDDRRQLLDQRPRATVPAEPVVGAAGDEVRPIHEPARVLEALLDAEQLEVVAVGAAGAVAEGDGPELDRKSVV